MLNLKFNFMPLDYSAISHISLKNGQHKNRPEFVKLDTSRLTAAFLAWLGLHLFSVFSLWVLKKFQPSLFR